MRRALLERLGTARVTLISAPAGSGKTALLRSWMAGAGPAVNAALVAVQDEDRDPRQFWTSVVDALRGTAAGSGLVRQLAAAPDLDGWAVVERLLADLGPLAEPLWLVIDDAHKLDSQEALRQLELLVMRSPRELRFVLAARGDVRLGLRRLRREGELSEIGAADLRFSPGEARALLAVAEVPPPRPALELLHQRTVAEYLLAEVLDCQPEEVRLLLRTSVLERVHAALLGEILSLLARTSQPAVPLPQPRALRKPLSQAETRVLRYLPTNLSAPEIAGQLSVSVNTIRTHIRHLYDKLGAHHRNEAVEQARAVGLLASSAGRP